MNTTSNIEQERKDFEDYFRDFLLTNGSTNDEAEIYLKMRDGYYVHTNTLLRWEGWQAARQSNQSNEPVAIFKESCDCGCNEPVATEPMPMLEFLADRFEYAGVSELVARLYANDIRLILAKYKSPSNNTSLLEEAAKMLEQQISWSDDADEKTEQLNEFLQVAANQVRSLIKEPTQGQSNG